MRHHLPLSSSLAIALLGLAAAVWPGPAGADSDARDHERARAALQAGEVMPLAQLLQKLQRSHPGQVLEVELERDDGRWVYEVKLLQPRGQLLKLEVDAATGEVLEVKPRKGRPPGDKPGKSDKNEPSPKGAASP